MFHLLLRLLSQLPLSTLQTIGRGVGRLVFALPGRYRDRLIANAKQAGYHDPAMHKQAAAEAGATFMELPKIWFHTDYCLGKVIDDHESVLLDARAAGRGIMYLTPHLGSFEMSARYGAQHTPLTVMFRQPRKRYLRPILGIMRNAAGVTAIEADVKGVRHFFKSLKRHEAVGMLPDQVPRQGEGVWAPFFGREAFTVTLPGKLAQMTNAIVIVACCERLPRGQGWRMHYRRAPDTLPDTPREQATLFNDLMQDLIKEIPTQYLWGYYRYKIPKGVAPPPEPTSCD